ncbi:hypothetical protein NPIL_167121 [Nephila pilipes]|uniref:Uncharacterized protein n=1 Tax=Nephila pilipes TaxID=299642 RepID=A0A8X6TM69_NEPPI|nr:hypothetical protein NPIL_167121 [Nephila pilipes]
MCPPSRPSAVVSWCSVYLSTVIMGPEAMFSYLCHSLVVHTRLDDVNPPRIWLSPALQLIYWPDRAGTQSFFVCSPFSCDMGLMQSSFVINAIHNIHTKLL